MAEQQELESDMEKSESSSPVEGELELDAEELKAIGDALDHAFEKHLAGPLLASQTAILKELLKTSEILREVNDEICKGNLRQQESVERARGIRARKIDGLHEAFSLLSDKTGEPMAGLDHEQANIHGKLEKINSFIAEMSRHLEYMEPCVETIQTNAAAALLLARKIYEKLQSPASG